MVTGILCACGSTDMSNKKEEVKAVFRGDFKNQRFVDREFKCQNCGNFHKLSSVERYNVPRGTLLVWGKEHEVDDEEWEILKAVAAMRWEDEDKLIQTIIPAGCLWVVAKEEEELFE